MILNELEKHKEIRYIKQQRVGMTDWKIRDKNERDSEYRCSGN